MYFFFQDEVRIKIGMILQLVPHLISLGNCCRDVAPDLELLELQQMSQQLHSLLGQCGARMRPSDPGFGSISRSLLKLLEHLLVFPMTTQLLNGAHIIHPVYECSKVGV